MWQINYSLPRFTLSRSIFLYDTVWAVCSMHFWTICQMKEVLDIYLILMRIQSQDSLRFYRIIQSSYKPTDSNSTKDSFWSRNEVLVPSISYRRYGIQAVGTRADSTVKVRFPLFHSAKNWLWRFWNSPKVGILFWLWNRHGLLKHVIATLLSYWDSTWVLLLN